MAKKTDTPAPIPQWADDPRYQAAAGKLAELRSKLVEAESDQRAAAEATGGAKADPTELAALKLLDPTRAAALEAAFGRLADANARVAAFRRAVELAAEAEDATRKQVQEEVARAELAGPLADGERKAAALYLAFLAASGDVLRRRHQLQNAGLLLRSEPAFGGPVASVPVRHEMQFVRDVLVNRGLADDAAFEAIAIG